jgi:mxaJ protein
MTGLATGAEKPESVRLRILRDALRRSAPHKKVVQAKDSRSVWEGPIGPRAFHPARSAAGRWKTEDEVIVLRDYLTLRRPPGVRAPRGPRTGSGPSRRVPLLLALATAASAVVLPAPVYADNDGGELRVCADPNNLPFSDQQEAGFENKLAALFAADMGQRVSYTWWAQRRGYIRNTLKTGKCDVIMGVPTGLEMVETTRPYYRSTYVFVSRSDRRLDLASILDPRLRSLKIGIQLIGDDGFNTPPAHALAEQGIVDNVVGYTVYGDYRQHDPPARIIEAVERGDIDIAAVWGPFAGYVARQSPVKLAIAPVTDTERFAPLAFQFDIAIGVRKGDDQRREALDALIARNSTQIAQILDQYGVPVVGAEARSGGADHLEPGK